MDENLAKMDNKQSDNWIILQYLRTEWYNKQTEELSETVKQQQVHIDRQIEQIEEFFLTNILIACELDDYLLHYGHV